MDAIICEFRYSSSGADGEQILRDGLRKYPGNDALAQIYLEKIPEIYFSKLQIMALLLDGEEKLAAASRQKSLSFEHLVQMLDYYSSIGEPDKAQIEYRIAVRIIDAFEKDFGNQYIKPLYQAMCTSQQKVDTFFEL